MSFIPIFVIRMPHSERSFELLHNLKQMRLEFEIQDAVVGANLAESEILEKVSLRGCDARLGYRISRSLIGCGLSHREIYKKASKSSSSWILVLEEDAILKNFSQEQIREATKICGTEPTIIQLFSRGSRLMDTKSIISIGGGQRLLFDFRARLVGSGAAGYLINLSAIQLALGVTNLNGAPDWPDWAQNVRQRGIFPWMINESQEGSTISTLPLPYSKYLVRRLMQFSGIHFLYYFKEYPSFHSYFKEELFPYMLFILWRIRGSKFLYSDNQGPQVL